MRRLPIKRIFAAALACNNRRNGSILLATSLVRLEAEMLLLLAIILFIAWILGFVAFHVTVGLIHLLLVFAVIALIWHLVAGRRATV